MVDWTTIQLLLIAPLIGGAGLALLSRWQRVTAIGGTLFTLALILAMRISENEAWIMWKRPFALTEEHRTMFTLMLAGTAILFALSSVIETERAFVPLGLLAFSPTAAAITVHSKQFAPLFLLLTFATLAAIAQNDEDADNAAARYLLVGVIAMPALLLVGTMGAGTTSLWLLLLATAVLSAAFPFIAWVRPLMREMSSLTAVYLFAIGQLGITVVLLSLLQEQSALLNTPIFINELRWGGGITALLGGLTALSPRSSSKEMLGSLLLVSIGIMAWGFSLPLALETAVWVHIGRFAGLLFATVGLHSATVSHFKKTATGLFAYGGLTLLGFPLTAGFVGQWHILTAIHNGWPLFLMMVGIGTAVYGFIRHLLRNG